MKMDMFLKPEDAYQNFYPLNLENLNKAQLQFHSFLTYE